MEVNDIIKKSGSIEKNTTLGLLHLNGCLKADHEDGYFRLYPEPLNNSSYYLIAKEDIAGDIYQWTKEELALNGIVGSLVHRVPLRFGTNVLFTKTTNLKIGETFAGHRGFSRLAGTTAGCNGGVTGCGSSSCCTQSSEGAPCYCDTCCIA